VLGLRWMRQNSDSKSSFGNSSKGTKQPVHEINHP
jgi:hypothetical protein